MRLYNRFLLLCISLALQINCLYAQDNLRELFENPPEEAKPRGYWIWAHGNYDFATIESELKAFKEMGIGGVDIFDMGIADRLDLIPPGNTFMGDKMLDGIEYALNIAKELDLQMGLSVSNGWNAGGDWTPSDEKLMRLLFWSDTVEGPARLEEIGFPVVPTRFQKPYGTYDLYPEFDDDGFPVYYENVALVAYPYASDSLVRDLTRIIYFDVNQINGNRTNIQLPEGRWVLTRAVVTPLGQKMWVRSDQSNGFIMDHYSKQATNRHFNHIIDKLESRMGDLGESALERLYLASFEAEDYVIWSPELRETFYRHHGYRIDPYIPVFTGVSIIDEETTERFLHDYRFTVSEMFVNNHYRQGSKICREHGILLASESGGPGPPLHYVPTEDLKALGAVDIMRGEFWNRPPKWKDRNGNNLIQVVKNIGSAAHVYGRKIVEMEAFTSHNGHWEETPSQLKILADRAYCEGMTRVVYHTMPHSPPEAGLPGWSYQAGTHIHPKMTWWPMSRAFHSYLARCSALLMQGKYVADVAYYKGGEVPNFSTTKYIRPDLGFGYDYDDINTEVLLQTTEVRNGKMVLPSGMEYELLVLPNEINMELQVIEKLQELISKGATVIGPKPERIYGLADYKAKELRLRDIADDIWGDSPVVGKLDKDYGKGRIIHGTTAREVLMAKGIMPDIQVRSKTESNIDYIHRATDDHEIYFVRNMNSTAVDVEIEFRVRNMRPEFWHADEGSVRPVSLYRKGEVGTVIPIHFEPKESVFVVFNSIAEIKHLTHMQLDGKDFFMPVSSTLKGIQAEYSEENLHSLTSARAGTFSIQTIDGKKITKQISDPVLDITLDGPWEVRFPTRWKVAPVQTFDELRDWTGFEEPNMKHFSGVAKYENEFDISEEELIDECLWQLDLGDVGQVARVYLNGELIGDCIFRPYVVDVTRQIKTGKNFLVVEVANTWRNRLIYDSHLPVEEQLTRSNVSNSSDPADHIWANKPLQSSGLMGPVRLRRYTKYMID